MTVKVLLGEACDAGLFNDLLQQTNGRVAVAARRKRVEAFSWRQQAVLGRFDVQKALQTSYEKSRMGVSGRVRALFMAVC